MRSWLLYCCCCCCCCIVASVIGIGMETTNQTRPVRINAISLFQYTKVSAFENLSILWSIVIHELSSQGFQQPLALGSQPPSYHCIATLLCWDGCLCRTLFNLLISINRHMTRRSSQGCCCTVLDECSLMCMMRTAAVAAAGNVVHPIFRLANKFVRLQLFLLDTQ